MLYSIPGILGTSGNLFLNVKNAVVVFNGEQKKKSIICERMGLKNLSLVITVCQYSASHVMPKVIPRMDFSISHSHA